MIHAWDNLLRSPGHINRHAYIKEAFGGRVVAITKQAGRQAGKVCQEIKNIIGVTNRAISHVLKKTTTRCNCCAYASLFLFFSFNIYSSHGRSDS